MYYNCLDIHVCPLSTVYFFYNKVPGRVGSSRRACPMLQQSKNDKEPYRQHWLYTLGEQGWHRVAVLEPVTAVIMKAAVSNRQFSLALKPWRGHGQVVYEARAAVTDFRLPGDRNCNKAACTETPELAICLD